MLRKNILSIKSSLQGRKILLVAKANAYGHGISSVVKLSDLVDYYGVAKAIEGRALRKAGVLKPILVFSYNHEDSKIVEEFKLTACVDNLENIKDNIDIHIAVDTGMNRFGVKSLRELEVLLKGCKKEHLSGIFSHIHTNSEVVLSSQNIKFKQFCNLAREYNRDIVSHIASSGSYFDEKLHYDMVRVGRRAYQDACAICSDILAVKKVLPYESIGYNGEFIAKKTMKIAIVEGGYADGIDKRNTGGKVIISGKFCQIIGAISMDSFMVDVSGCKVKVGDKAVICDSTNITAEDIALRCGCSVYEVLCGFRGRYNYVEFN